MMIFMKEGDMPSVKSKMDSTSFFTQFYTNFVQLYNYSTHNLLITLFLF